jgi:CRISPR/Cas system-associated exonuclease Cas4 (RecB family)
MRTIRASEIGQFTYCQRSWWYQIKGNESKNQDELITGIELHQKHGRKILAASILRSAAMLILLLVIILLSIHFTRLLLATN